MFIDRRAELAALEEAWRSQRAELVLVYGRRRIGKTRLLQEFLQGKAGWYFLADASENILGVFSTVASVDGFARFGSWDDFFRFIAAESQRRRLVVVIDEFQYLSQVTKAWPTILQRWWDTELRRSNVVLVLCGSLMSAIYRIARGYGSALYGRKTRELELQPLPFAALGELFPKMPAEERMVWYAIAGGVPRYLEEIDPQRSVAENLRTRVLAPTAFLAQEPRNLLFEEFKDVTSYSAILAAIAGGAAKFNEVATAAAIPSTKLAKYLGVLERIGIVRREWPVTDPPRSRNTAYRIADPFYRFWFRFVFPNRSFLELGQTETTFRQIRDSLNAHVGRAYEDVARQFVAANPQLLPFPPKRVGRWWRGEREVDIVALGEKDVLLAEVKWKAMSRNEAERIAARLKEVAPEVAKGHAHAGVVAKRIEGKEQLRASGILALDLADIAGAAV